MEFTRGKKDRNMGCKPSKHSSSRESLLAANLRDMEKNKKAGNDPLGHPKDYPLGPVTIKSGSPFMVAGAAAAICI